MAYFFLSKPWYIIVKKNQEKKKSSEKNQPDLPGERTKAHWDKSPLGQ